MHSELGHMSSFICQLAWTGEPACVWRGRTQAGKTSRVASGLPALSDLLLSGWGRGEVAEVPGGHLLA